MNARPVRVALLVLAWFSAVRAAEVPWPGHGTLSLDVPADWKVGLIPGDQNAGITLKGAPTAGANAALQITILATPPDKPVLVAKLRDQLGQVMAPYLEGSVEKKYSATPIVLRKGSGWYGQLTDASLVGKTPGPGNFRIMRNGLASIDDHTLVIVTMQFNDPAASHGVKMLGIVQSLQMKASVQPDALHTTRRNGFYELSVPVSRLTLKIPDRGLAELSARTGGSTESPRYFSFSGAASGVTITGWIESSERYRGFPTFWQGETAAAKRAGQPAPLNPQVESINGWEVVAYDLPMEKGNNSHLRAELSRDGTWIDLHASLTADRPVANLREELRALLRSLVVESH